METPGHICPSGLKLKQFLSSEKIAFEDNILKMREEVDAFKQVHNLKTTPQLQCACVGGDSATPLGFVWLMENVMMVAMAIWMLWAMIWEK